MKYKILWKMVNIDITEGERDLHLGWHMFWNLLHHWPLCSYRHTEDTFGCKYKYLSPPLDPNLSGDLIRTYGRY